MGFGGTATEAHGGRGLVSLFRVFPWLPVFGSWTQEAPRTMVLDNMTRSVGLEEDLIL